jgi:hypothetical protein
MSPDKGMHQPQASSAEETTELTRVPPKRFTGAEPFHIGKQLVGATLLDFWQWAGSDLLSNTFRGWVAEFIVACDLGIASGIRRDWEGFDLLTPDGIRIEVKTSGYVQTWKQKRLSTPSFSIRAAYAWDPHTDTFSPEKARYSDVYVFCLHHHKDKATADPRDLTQWIFYVAATSMLDARYGNRKSVKLTDLESIGLQPVSYGIIGSAIREALRRTQDRK